MAFLFVKDWIVSVEKDEFTVPFSYIKCVQRICCTIKELNCPSLKNGLSCATNAHNCPCFCNVLYFLCQLKKSFKYVSLCYLVVGNWSPFLYNLKYCYGNNFDQC